MRESSNIKNKKKGRRAVEKRAENEEIPEDMLVQ